VKPRGSAILRPASWFAFAGAVVSLFQIGFLIAMFAAFAAGAQSAGQTIGGINDRLVLIQYALLAPVVITVTLLTPVRSRVVSVMVPLAGLAGIAWIVYWQAMLITGRIRFEDQVGIVSMGFLLIGAWFVVAGYLASRAGLLRRGGAMGLLAALYVGYPVWAWLIGRRLDELAQRPLEAPISPVARR